MYFILFSEMLRASITLLKILLKRDSGTGLFLWILTNLPEQLFL